MANASVDNLEKRMREKKLEEPSSSTKKKRRIAKRKKKEKSNDFSRPDSKALTLEAISERVRLLSVRLDVQLSLIHQVLDQHNVAFAGMHAQFEGITSMLEAALRAQIENSENGEDQNDKD
jgi:hypothetical protein